MQIHLDQGKAVVELDTGKKFTISATNEEKRVVITLDDDNEGAMVYITWPLLFDPNLESPPLAISTYRMHDGAAYGLAFTEYWKNLPSVTFDIMGSLWTGEEKTYSLPLDAKVYYPHLFRKDDA